MKPARRVSGSGLELIKRFEGYRRSAARLADGRWTIGYGHVEHAREGAEVSHDDAEALLIYDLMEIGTRIETLVHSPLSQNQFDALSSFAFNVGLENFKSSSVLRRINEGEPTKAAFALEIWRRAPFEDDVIVIDALVRRRAAEKALFLTPDTGFVPAPTPVLPPEIDFQAECRPPLKKPVAVSAPLTGPLATVERGPDLSALRNAPTMAAAAVRGLADRLRVLVPDEPQAPALNPDRSDPEPEQPELFQAELVDARFHDPAPAPVEPQPSESQPSEPQPLSVALNEASEIVEPFLVPNDLLQIDPQPEPDAEQSIGRLLAFSAGGLFLFGFAVFWRLNADTGFGGQALSYIAGIFGIILIFYAANLLLKRFDDDNA